ncbi:MAG: hypothetical protein QM482_01925 [Sulfurospirillum sp.]
MFKTLFCSIIICSLAFGVNFDQNQSIKQELKWNKSKTTFVSEKEKKYQKYKRKLDAENKKLEEDGFCSCNNGQF